MLSGEIGKPKREGPIADCVHWTRTVGSVDTVSSGIGWPADKPFSPDGFPRYFW